MKNVGLFISTMNSGGAEHVVSRLSNLLNDQYNIYVILFENTFMEYECAGQLINMNIPARDGLWNKLTILFKRIPSLKAIKKKYKLDCVISFLDSPNFVNVLSKVNGCKQIVSIRNYSKKENAHLGIIGKLTDKMVGFLYKKADAVVPVSKVIAESLISEYKLDAKKIHVIYNPYDEQEINALAEEPVEAEFENFVYDKFIYVSVGRIQYQKGFWHLIKAFSLVHRENSDTRLVIVGEDCSDEKMKRLIDELGLSKVIYLTGRDRNPFKYVKRSDVYVLSSLYEGFPNAMVEAMICGLPVIAADCKSGPREILCETPMLNDTCKEIMLGDFGILVPELSMNEDWTMNDISSEEYILSNAMLELKNNCDLKTIYSKSSILRSGEFSYEKCRDAYANVINN